MLKKDDKLKYYMDSCNQYLGIMGALEHSLRHARMVADRSFYLLHELGFDERTCHLASIAGYFHDVGNLVNRYEHGRSGALLINPFLEKVGLSKKDISTVIGAVGNHEEETGYIVNPVCAAVIIADKSELHRERVRKHVSKFKQRDRVNYAVQDSKLIVDPQDMIISVELKIDTEMSSVMEYFEIFLTKMLLCQKAAKYLGCRFQLYINGNNLL